MDSSIPRNNANKPSIRGVFEGMRSSIKSRNWMTRIPTLTILLSQRLKLIYQRVERVGPIERVFWDLRIVRHGDVCWFRGESVRLESQGNQSHHVRKALKTQYKKAKWKGAEVLLREEKKGIRVYIMLTSRYLAPAIKSRCSGVSAKLSTKKL